MKLITWISAALSAIAAIALPACDFRQFFGLTAAKDIT